MVAEVPADTGEFVVDGDAHLAQVVSRPDAGEQEDLRRANGAAAQDDLIALHGEDLAATLHLDSNRSWRACRTIAIQYDPVGVDVAAHGEVEAMAGGVEEGERRAHAHAVDVVHGARRDGGVAVGSVLVGMLGDAQGHAGIVEGGVEGQPVLALGTAHGQRALGAVEVVAAEVPVVFKLAEEGQAVGEFPFVVAPLGPQVVVLGDAAEDHLAVDGRRAAHGPAAGDDHGLALRGIGAAAQVPAVGAVGG